MRGAGIFYHDSSRRFLINRALKIFPAYWAIALLYAMTFILLNPSDLHFDPWAIIVNISLLLSYLPAGNNKLIIDIAWAVVVECQFYLIAAALFFVARVTRMFGRILYAGGLAALALYLFIHMTDGHTRFYGAFRFAPYFVLGSASYYAFTRRDLRTGLLTILAGVLSLHAYLVYSLATPTGGLPLDLSAYSIGQIASTALFASGTLLFLWLFSSDFPKKAEQVDKRLGDITYSIYLIHPLIIYVAIDQSIADRFGNTTAYLFTLLVSAAFAVLIFRGIERPVMKLRNRFRGRRLYD